jgi:hypothetical protein
MTSWECYENKWFYMKYIGKMAETNHFCPHAVDVSYPINNLYWFDWRVVIGGRKFQVTMVLGRNEYVYASTLVLICRMLWAQDPLVLVVLIWMYWWSGTSTRLFRIVLPPTFPRRETQSIPVTSYTVIHFRVSLAANTLASMLAKIYPGMTTYSRHQPKLWSHSLADFHEIFTFKNRIN